MKLGWVVAALAVALIAPVAVLRSGAPQRDAGVSASAPVRVPAPEAPTGVGNVSGLSPSMRRAVARARAAAAADGVVLTVTSGWRTSDHQRRLYAAAIEKYGSAAAARRWVLPPEESAHVRGEAVDIGPEAAARWLEVHGVRFGLCRRYANEPWHFERLAAAVGSVCPPMEPHP